MASRIEQPDRILQKTVKELFDDRVGFVKHILKVTPTDQQVEGLVALDQHDHVSIRSGHGPGKSATQSWNILHYMSTRPFPKIPCTAPSRHQLHDILWAELSKWHRQMREPFKSWFAWTKEKFFHKNHPEEWFAVARTSTKENPEALQGFHANYILRILDEASGIPEAIFEVADGAHGMIETKEFMCANPTRLEGTFFRSHHQDRRDYKTLAWSCLDSPIVPAKYVPRMASKYGEDSNIYQVRVLGQFPKRDSDAFIPYDLVEAALAREIQPQNELPVVFGVDVARFGDDATCISVRQGDNFLPYHVLRQKDTMEVVRYVAMLARKMKPAQIFVDVIGIGAGVFDRLLELRFPVTPVCVSESPALEPKHYKKLRDELWGECRTWLEMRRGKLWDNSENDLLGQLTTPKYKVDHSGKIVLESKDDMKKRGLQSPDVADAMILTFAQPMSDYTRVDSHFDEIGHRESTGYQPMDPEAGY